MEQHNPFTLTFGAQPPEYLERASHVKSLVKSITTTPPLSRSFLITGVRGSGKTVLLSVVEKEFSKMDDWLVVELNPNDDMREALAAKLYTLGKVKRLFINKEFSFSFHGISFSLSGKNPVLNIEDLLERIFGELQKQGKKVLVCIDEVSNSEEMRKLASSFQMLVRKGYEFTLLGTGFSENIFEFANENNLTSLLRPKKINLSPLSFSSIVTSYEKVLTVSEEEAKTFASLTKGYAFAFQLLGYLLYEEQPRKLTDELLGKYDSFLASYVYDKIWSSLSDGDKKVMRAFPSNGPSNTAELLLASNMSKDSFSRYRDRLLKKGVIISLGWGKMMLALPRFHEYINDRDAYENI